MKKIIYLVMSVMLSQINFAQITNPTPYCDASFDDAQGFNVDDQINSVTFGALSNASNARWQAPRYVFYNNLPVKDFKREMNYTLTVNFDVHGGAGYGVWIDFNHDNNFDASEKVAGTTGQNFMDINNGVVITETVMIPASAALGQTRMRVRIVEDDNYTLNNGVDIAPCNASTSDTDVMDWGETEDYTINIIDGTTNVKNSKDATSYKISPNPTNGIFTIEGDEKVSSVEVYSALGAKVYSNRGFASNATVNLSNQPKGVYLVKVYGSNHLPFLQRIIVK